MCLILRRLFPISVFDYFLHIPIYRIVNADAIKVLITDEKYRMDSPLQMLYLLITLDDYSVPITGDTRTSRTATTKQQH